MFVFLSKFLPQFVYPVGVVFLLLLFGLILRKKEKWLKITVIVSLVILWVGGTNWLPASLVRHLETRYPPLTDLPQADVIVVLGGGTQSSDYPRSLVEVGGSADRMIYASWLYHQGVAPNLLLTGGSIPWMGKRTTSPASEMAEILKMLGVSEDALWLEEESLNTHENALYSKEILEEKGINRIVLVTSATHMPRSVGLFEKQGFEVIPAPTDFGVTDMGWERLWHPTLIDLVRGMIPSANDLDSTTSALKEYLGIFIYRLRGWL